MSITLGVRQACFSTYVHGYHANYALEYQSEGRGLKSHFIRCFRSLTFYLVCYLTLIYFHMNTTGISIFLTGAFGCALLGLKAYLLQNWVYLSVVCSAPFLPMLCFYFFVPESIRFLRVKGGSKLFFLHYTFFRPLYKHCQPQIWSKIEHQLSTTPILYCTVTWSTFNWFL